MDLGKWIFGVSQQIISCVYVQEAHWSGSDAAIGEISLIGQGLHLPLWGV
jgi:hypothetical protein